MNASEKRAAVRSRQERWMAARAVERDRAQVLSEIKGEASTEDRCASLQELSSGEDVLARVTERIHARLQREIRNDERSRASASSRARVIKQENVEELANGGQRLHEKHASASSAVREHIEEYLSSHC